MNRVRVIRGVTRSSSLKNCIQGVQNGQKDWQVIVYFMSRQHVFEKYVQTMCSLLSE